MCYESQIINKILTKNCGNPSCGKLSYAISFVEIHVE